MRETVLLFNLTDRALKLRLEQALFPFRVRLKKVAPEDYGKTLGALAGLPAAAQPPEHTDAGACGSFCEPMLIFAGIEDRKLDHMLQSLRMQKVRLPYKAILTPTNCTWTPAQCFAELCREHEAMQAAARQRSGENE